MATYVVEFTGTDPAAGTTLTYRFARGQGVAPTDVAHIPSGLLRWESPTQKIGVSPSGQTSSEGDFGELVIANAPDDISGAADYDDLATYAFQGRVAYLYYLPGTAWSGKTLVARGVLEQPVADSASLRFPLRDPRAELDAPLQTTKYAGTNVAPDGVEGAEDLKGAPKPIVYGVVSNWPGRLVNQQKLIWQLCDKSATILCVRDGAVPLTAGTSRGTLASLQSNAPTAGGYDYYAGAEGTFVRFGATPVYRVAFDVQEGATSADRTHAQIWKRIRTERCATAAGDILTSSVTTVDTADANEVGFAWLEETTRREALDRVLQSLVGYEVQDLNGDWSIGRLQVPSGTPAIGLVVASESGVQKSTDRPLIGIERARPSHQPNGSPPYRVNVRWGRNHTVMGPGDVAGSAAQRLKDKFSTEWRVETATDTTIWDPSAATGNFPNAPEMTVDTGYQPGSDNRSCSHAAERASVLLDLFSPLKGQYQARFLAEPGDNILPGAVVRATYPRWGLSLGAKLLVLQSSWRLEEKGEPDAGLLLGFPPDPDVVLLLSFDGQSDGSQVFVDESIYARSIEAGGNFPARSVIDTGVTKFGSGSYQTTDVATALVSDAYDPTETSLDLGTNPFSIDCWFRLDATSTNFGLMMYGHQVAPGFAWAIRQDGANFGFVVADEATDTVTNIQAAWSPAALTWYHVRVTRDASNYIRVFIDGVMLVKALYADEISTPSASGQALEIGAWTNASTIRTMVGRMDEIRIINGRSVWSSDSSFTLPTAPWPR